MYGTSSNQTEEKKMSVCEAGNSAGRTLPRAFATESYHPEMKQRLLVPVDGSEYSMQALDVAAELARSMKAGLVLCYVVDSARAARLTFGEPALADGSYEALREEGQYDLTHAMQRVARAHLDVSTVLSFGDPATEIERLASREHATMIVMGTHGRTGLLHLLMGSVAEGVMRGAPVPVVVVPATRRATQKRLRISRNEARSTSAADLCYRQRVAFWVRQRQGTGKEPT